MAISENGPVLVTGANGFVGMHCVLRLLQGGHWVRGTVRDAARGESIKRLLSAQGDVSKLSFVAADLISDDGWSQAVQGCRYVLHTASPVPRRPPKVAEEVIAPARDGALRVLRAAANAGVERVVMTSSTAAVMWGHRRDGSKVFDENDWSVLNDQVGLYEQSKTLAERAAWDFVNALPDGRRIELVTILPGLVLGPVLGESASISGEVVRKLLAAELPGCPNLGFATVDVRDVAEAHVQALLNPQAAGHRFIVANAHVAWVEIAQILARHYGPKGFKIPTGRLPDWLLKTVALFDKTAAVAVPELGQKQDVSSARAREVLHWSSRDLQTTVIDMAESLIKLGFVPMPKRAKTQMA